MCGVMKTGTTHIRILAVLALMAGAASGGQSTNPVVWQYDNPRFPAVDVLPLKDGSTCLLLRDEGPQLLRPGKTSLESLSFPHRENGIRYLRLFPNPTNDDSILVTGTTQQGPCVWEYRDRAWKELVQISDNIERPLFHQSANGTLWIHSWEGVIYSITDGKAVRYDYSNRVDKTGSGRTYYNTMNVAESSNGTLCFHSHFGNSSSGRALDHVLFFRQGKWENGACPDLHPGGACFDSDDKLRVISELGLTEFTLGATPEKGKTVSPPGDLAVGSQRPSFLTRLPDGTLISLWCRTGGDWTGKPVYPDGFFTRIVEYDGTKWNVVSEGADKAAWDHYQYVRPFVVDKDGALWLGTAAGGVLHRAPKDGRWQRLDWRGGTPCNWPLQMRMALNHVLWTVDQNGSCLAIDTATALALPLQATVWRSETLRSKLCRRKDGLLCALTDEQGGSLVTFTANKGKEFNKIPAENRIPLESIFYMTLDSEDGVWLFGDITQHRTGYFDGKKWTFYDPDSSRNLPYHCKEIAFQAQLAKGPDFRIGTPDDCYYPTFSPDGRIVFKNEWGRVCYFDGTQWHAPYGADELNGSTLHSGHPFFHDGKVTIFQNEKCYQMEETLWTKAVDDRAERPWKETAAVPNPFTKKENNPSPSRPPANCPIKPNDQRWTLISEGWIWVGGLDRLACSPGTDWITAPTSLSPLAGGRIVSAVLSDAAGHWFFDVSQGGSREFAVYEVPPLVIEPGEQNLGKVDKPFSSIKPPWRTARTPQDLLCRYRIDDGEWAGLQTNGTMELGGMLAQGPHRLLVEIFGRHELLRGPTLSYTFEVTFDAKSLVDGWIKQLGARSFADREKAAADLTRLGPAAVPALQAALTSDDPEIVDRVRQILKTLEPPDEKKDTRRPSNKPIILRGLMQRGVD